MSTTFLTDFPIALVARLLASDLLEVSQGRELQTAQFLARFLRDNGKGSSLLSTVEKALLKCNDVEEFYADQETLKGIIETLKYGA